ncbi:TPR repeat-containing protein [Terrimicrobium sacchariphilum]|uniref:TPR repeat-containing protein n=1 Tax=Terrimicrobium sacchariphilum TaxID=690879 RepID=A0A146GC60_TERSA|nr:tetratricopeptide repeat protein [Terrimicrobium sacchariphilum]GAT34950.1 TPR repeat-containing protein [Terrimicrobium sacchariphilum]
MKTTQTNLDPQVLPSRGIILSAMMAVASLGPMTLAFAVDASPVPSPAASPALDAHGAKALYAKGLALLRGTGGTKDAAAAGKLFQEAAQAGSPEAQAALGYLYSVGQGMPKDEDLAIKYLRMASAQKLASAQHNLAIMLLRKDAAANEAEAIVLLSDAADRGFLPSQIELGETYFDGKWTIKPDPDKAFHFMQLAAARGNASAANYLGVMYNTGSGVTMDKAQAAQWFEKAARQGEAKALVNLGRCYASGSGVEKNLVTAYALFKLGNEIRTGSIGIELTEMEHNLTPEQRQEAVKVMGSYRESAGVTAPSVKEIAL